MIDVVSAFYSMIKEFVVGLPTDEARRRDVVQSCDIPFWMMPALQATMSEPALLEGKLTPHLERLLAESQRGTWFSVGRAEKLALARKGSRPGNSLADVLHGVLFSKVLSLVHGKLEEQGLLCAIEGPETSERLFVRPEEPRDGVSRGCRLCGRCQLPCEMHQERRVC